MKLIAWDIGMKKMKERSETSNWIVDHFLKFFVNLSLAWILYFDVWLQNGKMGKLFGVNAIINLAYINHCSVSILEACQMYIQNSVTLLRWKNFAENSQQLKVVNYLRKALHVRCLTVFLIHLCNLLLTICENWGP